jgi:hypothetical protein
LFAALGLSIVVSACEAITFGRDCTTDARPGLIVEVRDSLSGQSVIDGSTLLIVSGTYQEQETIPAIGTAFAVAYERPGTYEVTVRKVGYADWRTVASVREDDCHVRTVRLIARLRRL